MRFLPGILLNNFLPIKSSSVWFICWSFSISGAFPDPSTLHQQLLMAHSLQYISLFLCNTTVAHFVELFGPGLGAAWKLRLSGPVVSLFLIQTGCPKYSCGLSGIKGEFLHKEISDIYGFSTCMAELHLMYSKCSKCFC